MRNADAQLATSTSLAKAGPTPAFVLARVSPLAAAAWLPVSESGSTVRPGTALNHGCSAWKGKSQVA